MKDSPKPYEAPTVEELDADGGSPVATSPGITGPA